MDPTDFQTDSETDEQFLPEGLGSDVDEHTICESDADDDDGTPKMSPVGGIPEFSAEQDLGALIAGVGAGDADTESSGPALVTSSFLSMPEDLRQEDLHVKKAPPGAVVKESKGKGKKRTKRKAAEDGGETSDGHKKKKKKKSKKEGKKKEKDEEKKKKKEASDRSKRRNIK